MITLPLDLNLDGVPHRVTRIGPDAVVYHLLGIDEATNELVRITPDTPEVGYNLTDDTTADDIAAHLANPPALPIPRVQSARVVLARLTPAERSALRACEVPEIQDAYDIALIEGVISESDPDFPAFRTALDSRRIIAASRWPDLLAP